MKAKVSIIIPVFNIQDYLRQCLDSVLGQTYADWECILVDDGSTDSSGMICDEYAAADGRFRVFHKENGGVSSARNVGIEKSLGELVTFIDSDDYVRQDYLEVLLKGLSEQSILSISGFIIDECGKIEYETDTDCKGIASVEDFLVQLYKPTIANYIGYICGKLYRRSILTSQSVRFSEDIFYNEDRLFLCSYLCASDGLVSWDMQPTYCYMLRDSSAMNSLTYSNAGRFFTDLVALARMRRMVLKRNKALSDYTAKSLFQSYHSLCSLLLVKNDVKLRMKARLLIVNSLGFVAVLKKIVSLL